MVEASVRIVSLRAGHSPSSIANQAVSRLAPFTIMCCRKIPSNWNPSRNAARRDGSFKALHFHSYLRYPRSSNTYRASRYIASVAPRVRCKAGVNKMFPTSIQRCAGSIRISDAKPVALPAARSTIAKNKGSALLAAFFTRLAWKPSRSANGPSKRYSHKSSWPFTLSHSDSPWTSGSSGTSETYCPSIVSFSGNILDYSLL